MLKNSGNEAQRPREPGLQVRTLLVIIALLLGVAAGLVGGFSDYLGGATVAGSLATGSVAFAAMTTLVLLIQKALGLLDA